MNIVNLTYHAIRILAANGTEITTLPPSGTVIRVTLKRVQVGVVNQIPVYISCYGKVDGLPDPQRGTVYVVSALVRLAVPDRRDVMSPGELVREAKGQPVGCRGLEANS